MYTEAVENYLKAVYYLQLEDSEVTTSRLSVRLKVKPASVTGMMKKMTELGLLDYKPYQHCVLTPKGKREALKVLRRHRIIELFLVEIMGLPWEKVHREAEKWEHVVSDEIIERMDQLLGYPTSDPHGSPIPSSKGTVKQPVHKPLTSLTDNKTGTVAQVDDEDESFLIYLNEQGIKPGVKITLLDKDENAGLITLMIKKKKIIIGENAAEKIYVT